MQVKIRRYEKNSRGLPIIKSGDVLYDEFDISQALVYDDIIFGDELELGEFFENIVPSTTISLISKLLDNNVISNLNNADALLGIDIIDTNETFSGFIDMESVEFNPGKRIYSLDIIDWWKYIYDISGDYYCPEIPIFSGKYSIYIWLKETFQCAVVSDVKIEAEMTADGVLPYMDAYNYQIFAPVTKLQEMINNIHKVFAAVAFVKDKKIHLVQYHKTINTASAIDDLIIDGKYNISPVKYSNYDTAYVTECGINFYRRIERGNLVTGFLDLDGSQIKPSWKAIDLRQKIFSKVRNSSDTVQALFADVKVLSDNRLQVLDHQRVDDVEYASLPLKQELVGQMVMVYKISSVVAGFDSGGVSESNRNNSTKWRCVITDVEDDILHYSWFGREDGTSTSKPVVGVEYISVISPVVERNVYDIELSHPTGVDFNYTVLRRSNSIIQTSETTNVYNLTGVFKSGHVFNLPIYPVTHPYLDEKVLYRIFKPRKINFLTVIGTNIKLLDEVTINGEKFRVIKSMRNKTQRITELEIEAVE